MTYSVDRQVAELKKWVGFHEGGNNSNPFSLWHGYGTTHLPWCDSFAQYCAVNAGGFVWKSPYAQFGPKGSGYVPTTRRDAQYMGIWRAKNTRARPGRQVHFDWNGDGIDDHDETVIADDGVKLVTIGGNTSDAVLYRTRDRRYVTGFVALDEAGQNGPPAPPEEYEDMIIRAPQRQQRTATRPASARLDIAGKKVVLQNGAKVQQPSLAVPVPAGLVVTGWYETFNDDGSKKGFVAMGSKASDGFPAYEWTWA